MDNIKFETIWVDDSFFQIEIECNNSYIQSCACCYVNDFKIDELINSIEGYLTDSTIEPQWAVGEKDSDLDSVFLKVHKKDLRGHLQIEVYMEIADSAYPKKQTAHLYVNTELGCLYEFSKKLKTLKNHTVETVVSLNN